MIATTENGRTPTIEPNDDVLLLRSALIELGITPYTGQKLRAEGRLPTRKIGRFYAVLRADVERCRAFLAEERREARPA